MSTTQNSRAHGSKHSIEVRVGTVNRYVPVISYFAAATTICALILDIVLLFTSPLGRTDVPVSSFHGLLILLACSSAALFFATAVPMVLTLWYQDRPAILTVGFETRTIHLHFDDQGSRLDLCPRTVSRISSFKIALMTGFYQPTFVTLKDINDLDAVTQFLGHERRDLELLKSYLEGFDHWRTQPWD